MLLAAELTISWGHVLARCVVAAALGGAIGLEREIREREAGLRTHMLVALGAALFTLVSAYGFSGILAESGPNVLVRLDPSRIAAQVVSGIGFLGAGAIIRQGLNVRGLTTAATLWVAAAIGMAAGAGFYTAAVITTGLVILSLWPLRVVAHRFVSRVRPDSGRLLVQLPAGESPGGVIDAIERAGGRVETLQISHEADRRTVELDLQLPPRTDQVSFVTKLADVDSVLEVRWAE